MRHVFRLLVLSAIASSLLRGAPEKLKVLIIDGQNNHQWATTTPLLVRILEDTGRFKVDVSTTPPAAPAAPRLQRDATPQQKAAHEIALKKSAEETAQYKATAPAQWAKWRPNFSAYDVVVSNYNGERWPAEVEAAFVSFVQKGGGFVSYHAADNAFPDWPEYNRMIGLGGWGGRNEKAGPYLRLRDGAWTRDFTPGTGGGHGAQHEFLIEANTPDHAILAGLPPKWWHAKDELYHGLRGPAEELTVLASALSDRTHEREPMLMAIRYGNGRVFHTTLGHYVDAINGLGFQVTFVRGTEWAASGKVTLPAPAADAWPASHAALREVKVR